MYEAGAQQNAEGSGDAGAEGEPASEEAKAADAEEDVVDADFEEVE